MSYFQFFILLLVLCLLSCKHNGNKNIEAKDTAKEVSSETISQLDQKESKHSINDFQGIWVSFSQYLEHESAFKDHNKNTYYKIVNGNEILDITLIDDDESNVRIDEQYLGFLDILNFNFSTNEEELVSSLQKSGSTLVRFKKGQEKYDKNDIEISSGFNRYYEITEILDDGFDYDEKDKYVSFRSVSSLPMEIFSLLKTTSKKENLDYIKMYDVENKSSKVRVKVSKTFFHTEMSSASKRKAFLVKGDIAYLEEISNDWVKVYYDGNIVSGGYIKRSDIEVLE
ncbi:hypothetical protein [uncultured Aquimarina sp.]|uniref:hypothetical protein n=1 Tax=uncultured Aquimarina sp. TaxID=575652 RepID=UPI002626BD32|nr:hypothetical protein [uncultured Aquimarina sp.]